jgi:outer membrane lipoprotein-sorting protein
MARIQTGTGDDSWDADAQGGDPGERPRRRKSIRYAVPVVAAGAAAATIGLVPALASTGAPNLPTISAKQLIAKVAASDTQTLSGTVRVTTDFGLPSFLSGAAGASGLSGLGGSGKAGGSSSSSADPKQQLTQLLSGTHTLQVAADGPEHEKVSIVQNAAEYTLIHNGQDVWAYDSGSNSAYHRVLPADQSAKKSENSSLTPQQAAQKALAAVDSTTSVTVDGTASVAGRDAYQLLIQPKQSASTVGSIRIAVDSSTGVPLRFTLTPKSGGKAAVDVGFTKVDFAKPAASTFAFKVPKGAKVTTEKADPSAATKPGDAKAGKGDLSGAGLNGLNGVNGLSGANGLNVIGQGWDSIAEIKGSKNALGGGDSSSLLGSFGKRVNGGFGSGTVVSTRLVNALITDKGTAYVGAVSQDALVKAANAAK